MKRFLPWSIAVIVLAGVCWLWPLFRIVPLGQARKVKADAVFNPARFAEQFWDEQLLKSLDKAVPAERLLATIQTNAAAARKEFSRNLGLSDSYTYFVSGVGRVLAVSDEEVSLAISTNATSAEISLQVGMLFGNTIRDGTGLLSVNDYSDSQDFNAIAEALNQLVETRVQPRLRERARVGAAVRFAGCAEVSDESADLKPLKLIPIQAEVQ